LIKRVLTEFGVATSPQYVKKKRPGNSDRILAVVPTDYDCVAESDDSFRSNGGREI